MTALAQQRGPDARAQRRLTALVGINLLTCSDTSLRASFMKMCVAKLIEISDAIAHDFS